MKAPLETVYSMWVDNRFCSAYQLSIKLTAAGYTHTESTAAAILNQAILAASSGQLRVNVNQPNEKPNP